MGAMEEIRRIGSRARSIAPLDPYLRMGAPFREDAVVACARIAARVGAKTWPVVMAAMRSAARDRRMLVRNAVAEEGWVVRTREMEALLIELLRDRSWIVRCSAAESLGELPSTRSRSALRAAIDDEYAPVRGYVALSLGRIGASADRARLRHWCARERDDAVQTELAAARARLGDEEGFAELLRRVTRGDDSGRALNASIDLATRDRPRTLARWRRRLLDAIRTLPRTVLVRRLARRARSAP